MLTSEFVEIITMSLAEILSKDDPELLSSYKELPFDILSLVINSRAHKCYSFLKNSPDFKKYVRNITHINSEYIPSEILQDFLESELWENENWVDLAVEMKSSELINKLKKKVVERAVSKDDAGLLALVKNKNQYTEKVFRRGKCDITER